MRSVIRMLTPDYLEHCADAVILLYQRLDEAIARDIARRLMKMGEVTDTARWQAEQLQHAGRLYDEVIAEVARHSGMTQEAVRKAFEDAGVKSMDAEIEQYLQAGINVPPIRRNGRAWNILPTDEGRVETELLRRDVPSEEAGRPERVLRLGAAMLLLSPLSEVTDPL